MKEEDISRQGLRIGEAHFDRGEMASEAVGEVERAGGETVCKPLRTRNDDLLSKDEFSINSPRDWHAEVSRPEGEHGSPHRSTPQCRAANDRGGDARRGLTVE
jgi:hypothetical protein